MCRTNNILNQIGAAIFLSCWAVMASAQQNNTLQDQYNIFNKQKQTEYRNYRQKANREYAEFMRKAWVWYKAQPGFPMPDKADPPLPAPVPPSPKEILNIPEQLLPFKTIIPVPEIIDQPTPIVPILEIPKTGESFYFTAYGTNMQVRLDTSNRFILENTNEEEVAKTWRKLSSTTYNNLILDCLTLRSQYNLCDWAYLHVLEYLTGSYLGDQTPEAILLQAFLFNQSGYKIRLGRSQSGKLYLLIASRHLIYDMPYFIVGNDKFYPLHYKEKELYIYDNAFPEEKQLSLIVGRDQLFAAPQGYERTLQSKGHYGITATIAFNKNLIDFYNSYPQSSVNNDGTTKWTFYANTPLSNTVTQKLYPILKAAIAGKSEQEAANILINLLQTGLVYGYDDEIWGEDRPFFPDETLYYPYSDCEDRAILYSRLVRDLLHLETVLLYYPGHLAMATCFNENVGGKSLLINGKKYTYCEPTCTGYAPIGWCPKDFIDVQPKVLLLK